MPALSFQKRFAEKVERGEKTQTVRAPRKRPIKVGDTLYLYTGMRTKECRKLGEAECMGVETASIDGTRGDGGWSEIEVVIGNRRIPAYDFAIDDGFRDEIDMIEFFEKGGLPFVGHMIRWELRATEGEG